MGNIRRACQKNKMRPVCDHNAYRDSYCYNSGRNLHFSYPAHDRQLGVNPAIMRGVFFYTGRHHLGSLLNTGSSHRWRNNNDRNKLTMCAKGGTSSTTLAATTLAHCTTQAQHTAGGTTT